MRGALLQQPSVPASAPKTSARQPYASDFEILETLLNAQMSASTASVSAEAAPLGSDSTCGDSTAEFGAENHLSLVLGMAVICLDDD